MSVLSRRIRQRREQLGFTQVELAEAIKSTQMQIWRYESGKGAPSIDTLVELAAVLDTSADWLVGLTDEIQEIRGDEDLSDLEQEVLHLIRSKSPEKRQKLLEIARLI